MSKLIRIYNLNYNEDDNAYINIDHISSIKESHCGNSYLIIMDNNVTYETDRESFNIIKGNFNDVFNAVEIRDHITSMITDLFTDITFMEDAAHCSDYQYIIRNRIVNSYQWRYLCELIVIEYLD